MPADRDPARPRPGRSEAAPARDALGRDSLRAFEAYFASEQANLEALAEAAASPEGADPEVAEFYRAMAADQRRSLASLSFQIASLLPDTPPPARKPPAAITSLLTQNRARQARALAASIGTRRGTGGLALGLAAAIAAFAVFAARNPAITTSTIALRHADAAAIVSTPVTAPTPQPGVIERARIVAIYGHPYEPITGILGEYTPEEAARQAQRLASEAQAADGRPTVGALHITVHVAQAQQTSDGTYLDRMDDRNIQPWVDAAKAHGLLLILDTQLGWSNALVETKLLESYLRLPFVHMALDPEFATKGARLAPGKDIGTLDAASINQVQAYLGDLVRREGLPRKMLMVHQFRGDMITNANQFAADPDIAMIVDMDGFGSPGTKIDAYEQFALAPYSEHPGIKLFFHWDEPMMTPHELAALSHPPDVVIYQ